MCHRVSFSHPTNLFFPPSAIHNYISTSLHTLHTTPAIPRNATISFGSREGSRGVSTLAGVPLTGHDPSGGSQQLGKKGTTTTTNVIARTHTLRPLKARLPILTPPSRFPSLREPGPPPQIGVPFSHLQFIPQPPSSLSSLPFPLTRTHMHSDVDLLPLGSCACYPIGYDGLGKRTASPPGTSHTRRRAYYTLSSHPGAKREGRENHARQHRPRPLFFLRGVRYARTVVTPPSAHRRPGYDALTLPP